MKKSLILFLIAILLTAVLTAGCAGKDAASGAESQTAIETTGGSSSSSTDEKYLDVLGHPTLYAITELSGPELVTLLEEQGYEWEEKDETLKRFQRFVTLPGETIPQQVTFNASDKMYEDIWDREDYDSASEKGSVAAGQTNFIVAGYGDPTGEKDVLFDDVIASVVNIELVDQYYREDIDAVLLIAKDASGKEYVVMLQAVGPARTDVAVFTDELFAANTPPSSIAEQWTAFTGMESYGQ